MRLSTTFLNQIGLNGILEQQAELFRVQQQVASGKRILSPSDDPSGSSQVLRLSQAIDVTNQHQRNADIADSRLSLEETTIKSAQGSLVRIKELALQGNNSTMSTSDRRAIAQEVRERLNELLSLSNTRDANQEYLFSGYKVTTQPFIQNSDGTFSYNGDQGQRQLQISSSRQVNDSHPGTEVFTNIFNGNGSFQVNDNATNTGSGIIDPGQVFDSTAYVADTYTITFTVTGSTTTYGVTGAASGVVIAPGAAYTSGSAISFNGIETNIQGAPANGDTFTVSESNRQDVFSTVRDLAIAMEGGGASSSSTHITNSITRGILDLDQAMDNMIRVRTDIGARLNTIDDQKETNVAFIFEMESTKSQTEDLDMTEAIVELTSRLAAFEAAQASFARIQNLSLFQYI